MSSSGLTSWEARAALRAAADHLVALTAEVPADAWTKPGLGEWTVRELTGHAARALSTIEQYLEAGAMGEPEVESASAYFLKVLTRGDAAALNAGVAQRGREAGAALGDDPATAVRTIAERVLARVDATADGAVLPTAAGRMRLIDYLPTRIFELTVHSLDLAAAVGLSRQPSQASLTITLELAAALAVGQAKAGEVLLAITGRRSLPAGFSIL